MYKSRPQEVAMEHDDGQLGFLFADLVPWNPKDAQVSMEHPFFSLSKKPDRTIRYYEHNGNTITVTPSVAGMPTIWDKEVLIFCCSQIVKALDMGRMPSRTIRTTAYTLLKETHRSIGIRGYQLLEETLERLRSVTIKTNIKTADERTREGFGLIERWKIVENPSPKPRMISIEIELSTWLYRAVINKEILTLNKDYFKLTGGIERRVYELCRKHCGNQAKWEIGLELLHKKSGSKAPLKTFKHTLGKIAEKNELPDYRLLFQDNKLTAFYDPTGGDIQEIIDIREILDGLSAEVGQ
jgi:plasmid replication initiation protein